MTEKKIDTDISTGIFRVNIPLSSHYDEWISNQYEKSSVPAAEVRHDVDPEPDADKKNKSIIPLFSILLLKFINKINSKFRRLCILMMVYTL